MRRSDQDAALQAIYDQVPDVNCKGLCADACGPIEMHPRERQRVREAGVKIPAWQDALAENARTDGGYWCPALTKDHQCSVYEVRPLICRLWGASKSLECPYGCAEESGVTLLSTQRGHELMAESESIGAPDHEARARAARNRMAEMHADPQLSRTMTEFSNTYRAENRRTPRKDA